MVIVPKLYLNTLIFIFIFLFIISNLIQICIQLFGSEDLRANLEWSPTQWRQEPWRLLTYGLVHAHAAHLALNALVALAVSRPTRNIIISKKQKFIVMIVALMIYAVMIR